MNQSEQMNAELQHRSEISDAELAVAEELGWAVAILSALAAHLAWESWLLTIPVGIGAYILAVFRYRRRAANAEDNYYRVAGLGQYADKRSNVDT